MNLGRVVLDEVSCDITAIELEAGAFVFYAEAFGTHTVNEGADVSVFGPDGELVFSRGPLGRGRTLRTRNGALTVRLPVIINDRRCQ